MMSARTRLAGGAVDATKRQPMRPHAKLVGRPVCAAFDATQNCTRR
jgi:hypothetical protein